MAYLEILVGESTYHGREPLTYESPKALPRGCLVEVPLRQKDVLGIVVGHAQRPSFAVKKLSLAYDLPPLPAQMLSLLDWIKDYYPAPLGIITQLFLPSRLPSKSDPRTEPTNLPDLVLPKLTEDQQQALSKINGPGLHLLHGETGSGKTRLYIELAKRSLDRGQSSLILTPEIGLTSQLANDFRQVFGPRVILVHSRLTDAARRKTWQELLRSDQPVIVIGPRSALFSPIKRIGFVAVDECHETAYKQDQAPYYHALRVAAKLAELHGATLVLGSATPTVADYFIAQAKNRPIIRMTQKAATTAAAGADVELVDMRRSQDFTSSPYLSNQLLEAIDSSLEAKEQTLLFLNRRGTARLIFCSACGWQASCPKCDLPLVYHDDSHSIRCHTCGFRDLSPSACPSCQNTAIFFKGIGTKAVVSEIARLFKTAKVRRFDNDNRKDERMEAHYEALRDGQVDIIIGTQTLAKGLDLPKLGLVGVINADTGLAFPDFSAQERSYQLLNQVLGRVGRGHRKGRAIVQSYIPNNPVIKAAIDNDWSNFYNNELKERQTFGFPPFAHVLKLTCRRSTTAGAAQNAKRLAEQLGRSHPRVSIDGPYPSFYEKTNGKFNWQLVARSRQRSELVDIIKQLPSGWSYDIDPINLL